MKIIDWYLIFSGEKHFKLLDIVKGNHQKAWDKANKTGQEQLGKDVHCDVLGGFDTKDKLLEVITEYSDSKEVLKENLKTLFFNKSFMQL
jgi:hypothetical protein